MVVEITNIWFKGGPEPLENEINKILGSKREDRFLKLARKMAEMDFSDG